LGGKAQTPALKRFARANIREAIPMDLRLTEDELQFRAEVRAFVRDNLPASIREKTVAGRRLSRDDYVRWTRILAAKGWGAPHWPTAWGGTYRFFSTRRSAATRPN
jgi:alkylation response protein AidB-like acyl-CoA dehydrogenase